MTSLQHHSHHVNHHNTSSSNNTASNNTTTLISPLNNSTSALSPVIQRKIESQFQQQQLFPQANRYSSGSVGNGNTASGGVDFDTTSIASVSESSHWSGGGNDDLENIALVNGSDTNTMENKDWCNYLKMSRNGYNSSEDDDDDDEEDNEYDYDENNDSRSTTSSNPCAYKSSKKKKNSVKKIVNKPADQVDAKLNHKKKKTNNLDPLEHKKHKRHNNHNSLIINNPNISSITSQTATQTTFTDENTDKKIPKKISQDSLKSSGAHYETTSDLKPNEDDNLSIDSEKLQNSYLTSKYDENYDDGEEEESNEEEDDDDDYQNEDDLDEDDDDDDDEEDDLDDDDIWTIKPKLYSYYEKQFKIMQPDLNGFITGSVAKPFFERSRLPLNELSKIWELSDVTRDGALSFAEFCTAMHLVVLRVRNFELPNELPSKLQPYAPLIDFNTETTAADIKERKTSADDSMLNVSDQEEITLSSPTQSSTRYINQTNQSSDKPLVFSIKPQIPSDSQIAHPVALRYNSNNKSSNQFNQQIANTNFNEIQHQNSKSHTNDTTTNISVSPASTGLIPEPPPRHSRSSSLVNITTPSNPISTTSMANSNTTPAMMTPKILQQQPVVPPRITSPPPAFQQQQHHHHHFNQENESSNFNPIIQQYAPAALLPPPPPPPPLPHHHLQHYQQQNRLQQYSVQQQVPQIPALVSPVQFNIRAPPPIPVTVVQKANLNHQTTDDLNKTMEKLVDQLNVFNLEKLKRISDGKVQASSSTSSTNSIERDALNQSIRQQTEQNQVLKRLFGELEKELRSLTDNRIALEINLDFLNTASNNNQTVIQQQQQTPVITNSSKSNHKIASNTPATIQASNTTPVLQSNSTSINSNLSTPISTQTVANVINMTPSINKVNI